MRAVHDRRARGEAVGLVLALVRRFPARGPLPGDASVGAVDGQDGELLRGRRLGAATHRDRREDVEAFPPDHRSGRAQARQRDLPPTFFVSDHSVGGFPWSATPSMRGPRHCPQERSASLGPAAAAQPVRAARSPTSDRWRISAFWHAMREGLPSATRREIECPATVTTLRSGARSRREWLRSAAAGVGSLLIPGRRQPPFRLRPRPKLPNRPGRTGPATSRYEASGLHRPGTLE